MRPLQSAFSFPLRCTVFLLNAGPSLLTWLCTSLSAGLPRWSFLALLPVSCFKHVWHRFLGCRSLLCGAVHALFFFFSSSSVVCSRSASLHLATALRSARGWASVCSGPCCESSSGPSVLTFALVVTPQLFLCHLDLFLKLRHVEEFPGCPHFTWDTFSQN